MTCLVGCHLLICFRAGANKNPTRLSYSDQAKHIFDSRKQNKQLQQAAYLTTLKDVLDKVMDYEPTGNVLNMNDHVFEDADDERDVVQIDGLLQPTVKPCLLDCQSPDGMSWNRQI